MLVSLKVNNHMHVVYSASQCPLDFYVHFCFSLLLSFFAAHMAFNTLPSFATLYCTSFTTIMISFFVKTEPRGANKMPTHCRSSRKEEGGGLRVASMAALSSGDWNLCLPRKRLRCCGEGEYLPLASTNEVIADGEIARTVHFHTKKHPQIQHNRRNRDSCRGTRQAGVYSQIKILYTSKPETSFSPRWQLSRNRLSAKLVSSFIHKANTRY